MTEGAPARCRGARRLFARCVSARCGRTLFHNVVDISNRLASVQSLTKDRGKSPAHARRNPADPGDPEDTLDKDCGRGKKLGPDARFHTPSGAYHRYKRSDWLHTGRPRRPEPPPKVNLSGPELAVCGRRSAQTAGGERIQGNLRPGFKPFTVCLKLGKRMESTFHEIRLA